MNKDEIKKALLYCQDYDWDNCDDCPYKKSKTSGLCKEHMHNDALELITEQENEIEQLKAEIEQRKIDYDILYKKSTKRLKQAKIDVLKELKEKCKFDGHTVAVYKNDIDEMIEELKK